jgi:putative FmdB family regulatory protein
MPIYEYRRPDGTTFEVQQSFHDEALKVDPETGVAVERVLHAPAVHFKGKGFYNTDYGKRSRQRDSAAEKSAGSDGGSGAGGDSGSGSSGDGAKGGSGANGTGATSAPKDAKAAVTKG